MTLLFDLDGTLTDSCAGICRCVNHALAVLGRETRSEPEIRARVGIPLAAIFGDLLGSSEEALLDRAIAAYRERFDAIGIFENTLYPGVTHALGAFRDAGWSLRLVTIKPTAAAERVLAHFDLARHFDSVHGTSVLDRGFEKATLVRAALAAAGAAPSAAIMIGDRAEDVRAARVTGTRSAAALWGYGARSELVSAGPDYLADSMADLAAWILAAPPADADHAGSRR